MPVVVTGASGGIARVLIPLLAQRGEVRAVVRDRAHSDRLRASGAKVAVAELGDTALMATVMAGAHTVVHLAGGFDFPDDAEYEAANLGTTRDVLGAAAEAGASRFLFLSYPGASAGSSNAFLRAKGMAEENISGSGLDHLILRSTHVYGPGQRWLELMHGFARRLLTPVIGTGRQRIAPIHVDDVAAALAAADDRVEPETGTLGLQGQDVITADELMSRLGARARVHVSPERATRGSRLVRRHMHRALLEVLAADSLADAPDAAAELGITLTPLEQGLSAGPRPGLLVC